MTRTSIMLLVLLGIGTSCLAQNGLVIRGADTPRWEADAQKIYQSACSAVEDEFRSTRIVRPPITLIIGANENLALRDSKEIRLVNWDASLFVQGVVVLVFDDQLDRRRVAVARRALIGATSVVNARTLVKQREY